MDRYYRFSKKLTQEEVEVILAEVREMEDVQETGITKDGDGTMYIGVSTMQEKFPEVMTRIVNICSRVAKCEISFAGFREQFCR